MDSLWSLTTIFLKQLIRSRALWVVSSIVAGMVIINYFIQSQFEGFLGEGASYDIATQKASSILQSFVEQIRSTAILLIVIVSALVAPESRKNGTTQFVLTLSISRFKLALSQYLALTIFIFISVIILHIGYSIAATNLGIINMLEMAFSWCYLLLPLILFSAAIFSFSLSFSAIETYIVFLAVPYIGFGLLAYGISIIPEYIPMFVVRFIDNLQLLYPDIESLIIWPKLSHNFNIAEPPFPRWSWMYIHTLLTLAFWILVGLWFYRNHDLGSRTITK